MKIRRDYFGDESVSVSAALNNLAVAIKHQGKLEEAEKLYEESLAILKKIYGEDHHQVNVAKSNLASVFTALGKHQQAQQLFTQALDNMNKEETDPSVMATMLNNMGESLRKQGNFEKSLEYFEQALELQRKSSLNQSNDPEIAKTLSSIARLYFEKGNYDKSEELLNEAMTIITNNVGKKHPHYAACITALGNSLLKQRKFAEAQKKYEESLKIRDELKEPEYAKIPTLQSLALALERQKKWAEAEVLFNRILDCLRQMNDGSHKQKLKDTLSSIANNMAQQQKLSEAESVYLELKELIKEDPGEDSLEYGKVSYDLGAVYLHQEKYDEAEKEFAIAKVIYEEKLGLDNEKTLNVTDALNEVRNIIYQVSIYFQIWYSLIFF